MAQFVKTYDQTSNIICGASHWLVDVLEMSAYICYIFRLDFIMEATAMKSDQIAPLEAV